MPTTKFFRVATEGATTDGRNIERGWIEQMAKNFNRQKYGARVWLEHIRGLVPGSPFDALGDVTAVQARTVEDGKLALFAQIEPLPALIDLNKRGQKLYSSLEITPQFADTGEAYLTGLAVTDSPASLGTDILQFAAAHAASNPFAQRKSSPDALFTEAVPLTLEFEETGANDGGAVQALLGLFARLIAGNSASAGAQQHTSAPSALTSPATSPAAAPDQPADKNAAQAGQLSAAALTQLGVVMQAFAATQAAQQAQLAALKQQHDALVTQLSQTPGAAGRPTATGGAGSTLADC